MKNTCKYSDADLIALLESNGYKSTFANVTRLKNGIMNGTIVLEEDIEAPDIVQGQVQTAPLATPVEPADIVDPNAPIIPDEPETCPRKLVKEYKPVLSSRNAELFVKSYLTEDCGLTEAEFAQLSDNKQEIVSTIARGVITAIRDKISSIDTSVPDKSRGDIKKLKDLDVIQNVINQIETLLDRSSIRFPNYESAIKIIVESMMYLNQYSQSFKSGYNNKKTILITEYQSIVLSIIATLTFIVSTLDFSNETVSLKKNNEDILSFAPLVTLNKFVTSCKSGEFDRIGLKDVDTLREFYLEHKVEDMYTVLEGIEYNQLVSSGLNNLFDAFTKNTTAINALYKAAGVLVLLFAAREALYALSSMKTSSSDMLGCLKNFANLNSGTGTKLTRFARQFLPDATFGSDLSKREIESENKNMSRDIVSTASISSAPKIEIPAKEDELDVNPAVNNPADFDL